MDIERLTKSQIILLTLLISFVTSIATGIVTVSLLDQAPSSMTRTINKVVERTVERVIPMERETTQAAAVQESVTTVVVKEDDKVAEAIAANLDKVVRIYTRVAAVGVPTASSTPTDTFKGYGVVVRAHGLVATADDVLIPNKQYVIKLWDGREYLADIVVEGKGNVGLLVVAPPKDAEAPTFTTVTFANQNTLRLGQTVISLTGEERAKVSLGAIAELVKSQNKISSVSTDATLPTTPATTEEVPRTLTSIETTIPGTVVDGVALFNIFEEVVAIGADGTFVPIGTETVSLLLSSIVTKNVEAAAL